MITYPVKVLDSLNIGKSAILIGILVRSLHSSSLSFAHRTNSRISFITSSRGSLDTKSTAKYYQCIVSSTSQRLFTRIETSMDLLNFAFAEGGGNREGGNWNLSLFVVFIFAYLVMILKDGTPLIYLLFLVFVQALQNSDFGFRKGFEKLIVRLCLF